MDITYRMYDDYHPKQKIKAKFMQFSNLQVPSITPEGTTWSEKSWINFVPSYLVICFQI
jgi:hypothetical protein